MLSADARIGRTQPLPVTAVLPEGALVDAGEYGELFVPSSQLPDAPRAGDELKVFLYRDGPRVLATARRPYLELGMVGSLKVSAVEHGTAYLNLGIPKDLILPVSERRSRLEAGGSVVVCVALDGSGRLFGTERLNRFIAERAPAGRYRAGQEVTAVPVQATPLGVRVVVDDLCYGLIYRSELRAGLRLGVRRNAYVARARPDGRLDITLSAPGRAGVESAARELLALMRRGGGSLPFDDGSAPADIERHLGMSKGRFKKAVGCLYRERLITIGGGGIALTPMGRARLRAESGREWNF